MPELAGAVARKLRGGRARLRSEGSAAVRTGGEVKQTFALCAHKRPEPE